MRITRSVYLGFLFGKMPPTPVLSPVIPETAPCIAPFAALAGQTSYVRNKARVRCCPLNFEGHTSSIAAPTRSLRPCFGPVGLQVGNHAEIERPVRADRTGSGHARRGMVSSH